MQKKHAAMMLAAIAIIGGLTLSGCSGTTTAGEASSTPVKIPAGQVTLDYTMPQVFTTTMNDVVNRVNAKGNVTLSAQSIGNTYGDLVQRVNADAAAGSQSDLALVPINVLPNLVSQGIAKPVDGLLKEQNVDLSNIDPAALSLSKVNGKLYGVPFALSAPILYYNADAFKAAGLDPDKAPTTWAQVASDAKALTAHGNQGVVYQWDQDQWVFQSQVQSGGGSMLNSTGSKVAFNNAEGVKALTQWTNLTKDGSFPVLTSTPTPDDRTAFTSGKLGIWVASSAFAATVKTQVSFDVRTSTFPTETGKATPLAAGGSVVVLLAKDKAAQQRAASVLAEFASADTSTSLIKSTGYLPINKTARDSSKYLKDFLAGQPLRAPSIKEIPQLTPWTTYKGNRSLEISQAITAQLQAALKGATTAKQALDNAANTVNPLIGVK